MLFTYFSVVAFGYVAVAAQPKLIMNHDVDGRKYHKKYMGA